MSAVLTAAEVADSRSREAPELTDEELLSRFTSSLRRRVDPNAMVYYFGETLPYHQALAREKADWLRRIRTYLAENKEREKQAREAQAKYEEHQRLFRERAAQGFYRKNLKEELAKYCEIYDTGCQLAGKLEAAQAAKAKLAADTETNITKLQKLLAENGDLINALSNRLVAQETLFEAQKQVLTSAIRDAKAELVHQWHSLRQPLLKESEQLIKKILKIDDYEAAKLAAGAHLVVELDGAANCNRGGASWTPTNDVVRLAHEVEERFVRLESYVNSPAYINRSQIFTNLPG
jgi:actin-related protein